MKKMLCIYQSGQGYVYKKEYSLFGSPVPEETVLYGFLTTLFSLLLNGLTKSKRGKKSTRKPQK